MQKKLLVISALLGILFAVSALVLQFTSTRRPTSKGSDLAAVLSEKERPLASPAPSPEPEARPAAPITASTNLPQTAINKPAPPATAAVQPAKKAAKPLPRHPENDPNVPKARQVLLAHRRISVPKGRKFPTRFCTTQTPTVRQTAPYLLISEKTVDRNVHAQAMANGAKVSGFLPNNALLIEADENALKNLSEDPAFIAAVEYEPMDKIQPQLLNGGDTAIEANVTLMNAGYLETMCAFVSQNGGKVVGSAKNGKSFDAILTRKLVTDLASKGEIRWIRRR